MKSLPAELALCTGFMEKIALSHPDISFALINNEKEVFKTSGSNDLYKCIHEIFGYNTSKNMIKIEAENYDYIIKGYVSNLNISKSNRNSMIILVNGRVVSNISVNRTIKDASNGLNVAMTKLANVTIQNANGVTQEYILYRTINSIGGSLTMNIAK